MKKLVLLILALTGFIAFASKGVHAEEGLPVPTVEQRLSILERKYELYQEAAAAKAKEATIATSGKNGFALKSADGANQLNFSGYIQSDYRAYLADRGAYTDQFLIRRARIKLDATINKFIDFRIQPDFAQAGAVSGGATLQDAYAELKYFSSAKLKTGKFTPAVGLERIQSSTDLLLNELGLTQNLVPNRDTGVQLGGDFLNGAFSYQAGIFNGGVDSSVSESDVNSNKDYTGRIFALPFKNSDSGHLQNLGLGLAGSVGDQRGNTATSSLTAGYKTDGQNTFFAYKTGAYADGQRRRISPQGYWYVGPFGVFSDWVINTQEVRLSSSTNSTSKFKNTAWQVAFSYVVTGENTSFKGIQPRKNFDPKNKTWGALELTGRYAQLRVDDDVFTKEFADTTNYAKKVRVWSGGFNWYLNNNVKVTSNYEYTWYTGGAGGSTINNQDRRSERAILSRVQISF